MKTVIERKPVPGKRTGFARVKAGEHLMTWRLFRRSTTTNRLFMESRTFTEYDDRRQISAYIWSLRKRLRDEVDAFDLAQMGLSA